MNIQTRAQLDVLASLDALEEPLYEKLDRAIFVEPKDRWPESEEGRQAAFVKFVRRHARGVDVYANVNAAKRTKWAANKAKREGMLAGAPDLTVYWPGGVAWVEFKNGSAGVDTKSNAEQVSFLNRLHRAGQHVAVFRTAERAIEWLRGLGAPIPEIKK